MAGFGQIYVVGGSGGFTGADGVNPIELFILVGASDREWLEPHYVDATITPLGSVRMLVPAGPGDKDALLDACIAFYPRVFAACPSLAEVEQELTGVERLDFDLEGDAVPRAWGRLREEAGPKFADLNIWAADLEPLPAGDR